MREKRPQRHVSLSPDYQRFWAISIVRSLSTQRGKQMRWEQIENGVTVHLTIFDKCFHMLLERFFECFALDTSMLKPCDIFGFIDFLKIFKIQNFNSKSHSRL